ncbi:hypothetical protein R1flu_026887 [Riccia fluitans]|uniref:Gem-associated protein 2 n=1 Tax=Riccia fluitans TaxID=41844 RepID=A0ABD1XH90_9MARC
MNAQGNDKVLEDRVDSSLRMEDHEREAAGSSPELVVDVGFGELKSDQVHCEFSELGHKEVRRYGIDELLGLWDASVKCEVAWNGVVAALNPVMEEIYEMEVLPDTKFQRRRGKNSDRRQRFKARRAAMLSIAENKQKFKNQEFCDPSDPSSQVSNEVRVVPIQKGPLRARFKGRKYHYDSDEYVESFQPQAFAVDGEPDFESGDPQDGWEYLRRVIWETARCPKIVVANIDPEKLVAEQTPYMPEIPAIQQCPPELLPSKDWERSYLSDFTQLRKELTRLRAPAESSSGRLPSVFDKAAWEILCFGSVTSVEAEDLEEPVSATVEANRGSSPDPVEIDDATGGGIMGSDSTMPASVSNGASEEKDKATDLPVSSELEEHLTRNDSVNNDWIHVGSQEGFAMVHVQAAESFEADVVCISAGEQANVRAPPSTNGVDLMASHSLLKESNNTSPSGEGDGTEFSVVCGLESHSAKDDAADDEWIHLRSQEGTAAGATWSRETDAFQDAPEFHAPVLPHLTEANPVCQKYECSLEVIVDSGMDRKVPEKDVIETHELHKEYPDDNISFFLVNMTSSDNKYHPESFGTEVSVENREEVQAAGVETSYGVEQPYHDAAESGDYSYPLAEGSAHGAADFIYGHTSQPHDDGYGTVDQKEDDVSYQYEGEYDDYAAYYATLDVHEEEDDVLQSEDLVEHPSGDQVFSGKNLLEDFDFEERESVAEIDNSVQELFTRVFRVDRAWELPLIHTLLRLDVVSRAAVLRHHISWLHSVEGLPQERGLWLLGLAAVVDTPLSGDTTAAFRAMLRYCSGVRASKKTVSNEELHMLNALITVAGLYFGQAETDFT